MLQLALGLAGLACYARALDNGLALTPPMGWSNWESSGCVVNETYIKDSADAMIANGMLAAGYNIIGVDDCWAEYDRNATGYLVPNANFSSGMKALGDYLHDRGFLFGLYSSAGVYCCQKTMPGSLGYEWLDAKLFAEWGVDYLKYDGCYMEAFNQVEQDAQRRFPFTPPPILRYPLMQQALNRTGRDIMYLCNFPWDFWHLQEDAAMGGEWVAEFCNAWRTGGDAQPGFGHAMGYVEQSEKYAPLVPSGPGRWNHLDSLEIGLNTSFDAIMGGGAKESFGDGLMTEDQEQAVFSLFALAKSMLFIGADVTTLSGHSLAALLNKEVIAINQDPLGRRGTRIRAALKGGTETKDTELIVDSMAGGEVLTQASVGSGGEVWAGPLANGCVCVVLLNQGSTATDISVTWSELGLPAGSTWSVRDLWMHAEVGQATDVYTAAAVRPTAAQTILLTPQ